MCSVCISVHASVNVCVCVRVVPFNQQLYAAIKPVIAAKHVKVKGRGRQSHAGIERARVQLYSIRLSRTLAICDTR